MPVTPEKINELFDLAPGDTISVVGAGGKTSLIKSLAKQARKKYSVAVTTTTKMIPLEGEDFSNFFVSDTDIDSALKLICDEKKIGCFFSALDEEGHALGLNGGDFDKIANAFDIVLVEADGASGCSLKIPREHEPVIPEVSNRVLWVIGLDIIGERFGSELFFKPELFVQAGFQPADNCTIDNLRKVLYAQNGYLGRFGDRDVCLCLNKSDLIDEKIKRKLRALFHERIDKMLLTSTSPENFSVEIIDNSDLDVAGIILAAGESSRFGEAKMLERLASKPILMHIVDSSLASSLSKIYVIINGESGVREILEEIKDPKLQVLENPDFREGMSTSILRGIAEILEEHKYGEIPAAMILLGDMPFIDNFLIDKVTEAFGDSAAAAAAPVLGDRTGHPAVFHPELFDEILEIRGDSGCREIIRSHRKQVRTIELDSAVSQSDIDVKSDILRGDKRCASFTRS